MKIQRLLFLSVSGLFFIHEDTAISINAVGSKYKTTRQDRKVMWNSSKSALSRPFGEDLRWQAIWMKEMLGYQVDEVAAALRMP